MYRTTFVLLTFVRVNRNVSKRTSSPTRSATRLAIVELYIDLYEACPESTVSYPVGTSKKS